MANGGRLTDAQLRNQRSQALRALRRRERSVDTQLEKIERSLDEAIENKEKITLRRLLGLVELYKEFVKRVNSFEVGLTDAMNIFQGGPQKVAWFMTARNTASHSRILFA